LLCEAGSNVQRNATLEDIQPIEINGASEGIRTLDPDLGKASGLCKTGGNLRGIQRILAQNAMNTKRTSAFAGSFAHRSTTLFSDTKKAPSPFTGRGRSNKEVKLREVCSGQRHRSGRRQAGLCRPGVRRRRNCPGYAECRPGRNGTLPPRLQSTPR
jgi:hypothetical protein